MGPDVELSRLVDNDTPKLNPLLANGLATEHMKHVEAYVDQAFRSIARELPTGLVYKGYRRCTPGEEYNEISKKRSGKRFFDVATSHVYLCCYNFEYNGEKLPPRYIFLPFISPGGTIVLGGSRFNISPVIADRVISPQVSTIFVRLFRDRLTFERQSHQMRVNGAVVPTQVVWCQVYHRTAKMRKLKKTTSAQCALTHYLFCRYGVTETFRMFGNCVPVIGGPEIDTDSYPESDWVICESAFIPGGPKPKSFGRQYYEPSKMRIAIRKHEFTPTVKALVSGLIYTVDYFPARALPEYKDAQRLWKILLGHIIWSGTVNEGKLVEDVDKHLGSLDEYIDNLVAAELKDIGVPCGNLYQLFAILAEKFSEWLLANADKINSMYDKQLSVMYYVMYEITSQIIKMMFRLKSASENKELTSKEIIATMNSTLRTGMIFSITKGHGEVSNISSSGDNLAFKITANLVPQSNSNRQGSKKAKMVLSDPSKWLHPSIAEVGGYSNLPKSAPDGRSRINHHLQLDARGVVQRNPERQEMLDECQQLVKRN